MNEHCTILSVQLVDEKSLIKKYQKEISSLKQELDEFRRGMIGGASQEEIMILRQQVSIIFFLRDRTKQQFKFPYSTFALFSWRRAR